MKKLYLNLIALVACSFSFGQSAPSNVDAGLFANGANGSNAGSGAYVEFALRIKSGGVTYNAVTSASDFIIFLVAPKTDFALSDLPVISQVNSLLYGNAGLTNMTPGAAFDFGGPDLYFPFTLGASAMNLSSLTPTWVYAFTFNFNVAKTAAQFNKLRIVDGDSGNNAELLAASGNDASISVTRLMMTGDNQLTPLAFFNFSVLPVNLLNFSAYKNGSKNTLLWTTASESNNRGFEVLRSIDGTNYSSIGFVNSLAADGTSTTNISYSFDDNNPAGKKQYYRLKQTDLDNRSKLSNIVLINGARPLTLAIAGLFPNPARAEVNVIIDAPGRDNVMLVVTDIQGKTVKQKSANVETGSNTIPVDISALAKGSYLVKVVCKSSDCDAAVSKFVKQ